MAHAMSYVDMRDEIPKWARDYAVGDEISFVRPKTGLVTAVPVAGFSTTGGHEGLPVFDARPFPEYGDGSVRVSADDVVPLDKIVDEAIDRPIEE